jgi:hypothetical protein
MKYGKYTHYFKKFDDNNCFLFNRDDSLSEFNSEEDKNKYEILQKELKEKLEKENEENRIKMEKEKFHIIVHSTKKEFCIDKWINSREDFLEIFNNNNFEYHLIRRKEILDKFATGNELLYLLQSHIKRCIPLSEDAIEYIYNILKLMESKGFYEYDINYKCIDFEEDDLVTLPYYLLIHCNKTGTETFYKIISDFKFDLNKPLIEADYGPLPFHAIDLLPNFEQEFPGFMKLCVEKGYNMNNTELFDSTQENITIIEAMYKIGNPELAEELKKLIV